MKSQQRNQAARSVGRVCMRGLSTVEMLYAMPFVLLLALSVVQFAMVFHARHVLTYALGEAARQGSMAHASEMSILTGLAEGMAPWLHGGRNMLEKLAGEKRALADVMADRAMGLLVLAQRSPTLESFSDWAVPALDERGEPIRGQDEIPNDNLDNRGQRTQPSSGSAGSSLKNPVGSVSGQTLADANLLRLELHYGVRLNVPIVGTLVLKTLREINGCNTVAGLAQSMRAEVDSCRFYLAGRIPVSVTATTRMMSTTRRSPLLKAALPADGRTTGASGAGTVTPQPSANAHGGPARTGTGRPLVNGAGRAGSASAGGGPTAAGNAPSGDDRLNLPWENNRQTPAMSTAPDSAGNRPLPDDGDGTAASHPLVCTADETASG